jgi:hypothetical protein
LSNVLRMTDMSNFAGLSLDERARLELETALEGPRARWAEIEKAIAAAGEVTTETEAENFTTVVAQLQALIKRVDQAHDDVKDPYLGAGRVVDAATNVLRDKIRGAKGNLELAITRYQLKKQRKIDEQRAEERRREAQDPEPAFVPHQETDRRRSRVRSIEGASAHLHDVVTVEVVDVTKIPLRYLNRPKVIQALISEIRPDAQKGDTIEGITVHRGAQSRVKS